MKLLDDATRARAIRAASCGMSLEGIAHYCGFSRSTLDRRRDDDPTLERDIMSALAEYEYQALQGMNEALMGTNGDPNPALASQFGSVLERRFPHRHGRDPRFRLSPQAASDGYKEDLADPERNVAASTDGAVIARLVDRLMTEDTPE